MEFMQVILILCVLVLAVFAFYLFIKNAILDEKNKVNDITNLMLDIELKKKGLDEKYKAMSIDDIVTERNRAKSDRESRDS